MSQRVTRRGRPALQYARVFGGECDPRVQTFFVAFVMTVPDRNGLFPWSPAVISKMMFGNGHSSAYISKSLRKLEALGLVAQREAGSGIVPNIGDWVSVSDARPKIPAIVRLSVLKRDGYRCVRCPATEQLEMDHVVPYSKGGGAEIDNLQTLCKPCNLRKGAQ